MYPSDLIDVRWHRLERRLQQYGSSLTQGEVRVHILRRLVDGIL